jgi:pSer/pThr/pTyr-binding forkhead associated (FHA) protein
MLKLILEDDTGNVREVALNGEVTIGRADDNVVCLPDRNISRHHVRITVEGDKVFVEDAGSSFGVYVDDELVQGKVELAGEKTMEFGDYRARLLTKAVGNEEEQEAPKEALEGTRILKPLVPAREAETVVARPRSWNVVFLVLLVGVAVFLGFFYFSLTKESSEAPGEKGVLSVHQTPHLPVQENRIEEGAGMPGEEKVEKRGETEKPIVVELKKEEVEEQAVTEKKPKGEKQEQKKEVAAVVAGRNLPQKKTKEGATANETTKPPQEKQEGGDCVEQVKQARDQGRYDRATKLLNSNVCKGNPEVAGLWESLGNSVLKTNPEQACEWWKRAKGLTRDRKASDRLENKMTIKCK